MGRQTNFVLNTTQEDIDNILPDNKELMRKYRSCKNKFKGI